MVDENGAMDMEITDMVSAAWGRWKTCNGVLCDRKTPIHRAVVRSPLLYGAEAWSTTKNQEKRLEVNVIRMLRRIRGVTQKDTIRNKHMRG